MGEGGRGREEETNLTGDSDLIMLLVANRTVGLVQVVEDNRHRSLGHTCLPLLIHQLLQAPSTNLRDDNRDFIDKRDILSKKTNTQH